MNNTIDILIIEDDPAVADYLQDLLAVTRRQVFSSAHVQDLSRGLRSLGERRFDAVLLDLGLPDSQGIDTALAVRTHYPGIPVIVLTGLDDEEIAVNALRKDIQDYLIKGQINGSLLVRAVLYAIERKRILDALRESEEKFRAFFESVAVGTAQLDPESRRFVEVNDRFCQITGHDCVDLLSMTFCDITHPEDQNRTRELFEGLISGKFNEYNMEKRYVRKDGRTVWVQVSATVIRDVRGTPVRMLEIIQDITDRKRAEEAVRQSEERMRLAAQAASFGTYDINIVTGEVFWSPELKALFGMPEDSDSKIPLNEGTKFVHPDDVERIRQVMSASMDARSGGKFNVEHRIVRPDGLTLWVNMRGQTFFEGEGRQRRPVRIAGVLLDIDERKRAEAALRESEERFRTLADNIAQLAWMADEKGWAFWYNKRWFDYTGMSPEEMRGWGSNKVQHPDHVDRVVKSFLTALKKGKAWEDTFPLRARDGAYRWFLCRAIPIRNEQGKVVRWFGTNTDITERMRMEEEIKHIAQHDPLTGLPNRRLFNEIITVEMAQARRNGRRVAVFFMDLDRFKEINDTLGHETGDELLKQTASRLRSVIRTSDTVARTGGDEFNVVIPDIFYPEYASEVAQKILNEIRKPFTVKGHELNVSTSIGISVFPDDGAEIEALLRYADIAMYYAKEHGRNMHQFYNPVINTRSLERIRFENSLRHAIDHNEFRLYFQPLVDVETGKIVSAEVLLRWQHPDQGLLEPGQFFEAAEHIGFMPRIDEWVLKSASSQIKSWTDKGSMPVCFTVNLSAVQFQTPDLVQRIAGILEESGMPPECLDIEVTETAAMGNIENTIGRLKELTRMGVKVSIDNFGMGYSSLNHLRRLPIRKLKIDRSFIRDIPTDSDDRAIISAVLLMAHSLKIKVVATGVETDDQLSFLREAHCDEAQGFLFSEPVPIEKFREKVGAGL